MACGDDDPDPENNVEDPDTGDGDTGGDDDTDPGNDDDDDDDDIDVGNDDDDDDDDTAPGNDDDDDDVDPGNDDDDDDVDAGDDDDDVDAGDDDDDNVDAGDDDDDQATLDLIDQELRSWSEQFSLYTAVNCVCYSETNIVEYEEDCASGLGASDNCVDLEISLSDSIDECSEDALLRGGEEFAEALACTADGFEEINSCLAQCPTSEAGYSDCFASQDVFDACPTFLEDLDVVTDTIEDVNECPDSSAFSAECHDDGAQSTTGAPLRSVEDMQRLDHVIEQLRRLKK